MKTYQISITDIDEDFQTFLMINQIDCQFIVNDEIIKQQRIDESMKNLSVKIKQNNNLKIVFLNELKFSDILINLEDWAKACSQTTNIHRWVRIVAQSNLQPDLYQYFMIQIKFQVITNKSESEITKQNNVQDLCNISQQLNQSIDEDFTAEIDQILFTLLNTIENSYQKCKKSPSIKKIYDEIRIDFNKIVDIANNIQVSKNKNLLAQLKFKKNVLQNKIAELGYPQSDDYMESKKEIDDYSDEDQIGMISPQFNKQEKQMMNQISDEEYESLSQLGMRSPQFNRMENQYVVKKQNLEDIILDQSINHLDVKQHEMFNHISAQKMKNSKTQKVQDYMSFKNIDMISSNLKESKVLSDFQEEPLEDPISEQLEKMRLCQNLNETLQQRNRNLIKDIHYLKEFCKSLVNNNQNSRSLTKTLIENQNMQFTNDDVKDIKQYIVKLLGQDKLDDNDLLNSSQFDKQQISTLHSLRFSTDKMKNSKRDINNSKKEGNKRDSYKRENSGYHLDENKRGQKDISSVLQNSIKLNQIPERSPQQKKHMAKLIDRLSTPKKQNETKIRWDLNKSDPLQSLNIDEALFDIQENISLKHDFIKIQDRIYQFGRKKVLLKLINGKLFVRIGGGFQDMYKFLKPFTIVKKNIVDLINYSDKKQQSDYEDQQDQQDDDLNINVVKSKSKLITLR